MFLKIIFSHTDTVDSSFQSSKKLPQSQESREKHSLSQRSFGNLTQAYGGREQHSLPQRSEQLTQFQGGREQLNQSQGSRNTTVPLESGEMIIPYYCLLCLY